MLTPPSKFMATSFRSAILALSFPTVALANVPSYAPHLDQDRPAASKKDVNDCRNANATIFNTMAKSVQATMAETGRGITVPGTASLDMAGRQIGLSPESADSNIELLRDICTADPGFRIWEKIDPGIFSYSKTRSLISVQFEMREEGKRQLGRALSYAGTISLIDEAAMARRFALGAPK